MYYHKVSQYLIYTIKKFEGVYYFLFIIFVEVLLNIFMSFNQFWTH